MGDYGRGSVRVNLRLPADTHAVIKRIAEFQEVPVNHMIQNIIEQMRPQLDRLAATVERAEQIQTPEQGVDVLGQLQAMSAHARSEADRLDKMIEIWQQQAKEADRQPLTA